MKTSLCFDTSALISLGHTELIDLIISNFHIIVTTGIIEELKSIAQMDDEDAYAARRWLKLKDKLEIREVGRMKSGENELFDICRKEGFFLISDDIRAIKRFKSEVKCYFSVHILYILYKKEVISRERAIMSIEKMRKARTWKANIISVTARTLFGYSV